MGLRARLGDDLSGWELMRYRVDSIGDVHVVRYCCYDSIYGVKRYKTLCTGYSTVKRWDDNGGKRMVFDYHWN